MSFFGLTQRSLDCNGDVIAWAEVPEIVKHGDSKDERFEGWMLRIVWNAMMAPELPDFADANGDCWWEGGMAG